MAANETRGELSLTLEGAEMILRPSYQAIVNFEGLTGKSAMELYRAAASASLLITEMAFIARECIRAWGQANDNNSAIGVNERRLAELIIEDGPMLVVMKRLELLLFMVITGGITASGEVKPAPTTTEITPAIPGVGSAG